MPVDEAQSIICRYSTIFKSLEIGTHFNGSVDLAGSGYTLYVTYTYVPLQHDAEIDWSNTVELQKKQRIRSTAY